MYQMPSASMRMTAVIRRKDLRFAVSTRSPCRLTFHNSSRALSPTQANRMSLSVVSWWSAAEGTGQSATSQRQPSSNVGASRQQSYQNSATSRMMSLLLSHPHVFETEASPSFCTRHDITRQSSDNPIGNIQQKHQVRRSPIKRKCHQNPIVGSINAGHHWGPPMKVVKTGRTLREETGPIATVPTSAGTAMAASCSPPRRRVKRRSHPCAPKFDTSCRRDSHTPSDQELGSTPSQIRWSVSSKV